MGKSFHERLREAARLRRTTIQDTRRQIASIYERAIADLILKAENAGSLLTRQWAETYVREMKARIHEIWLQVDELTKAGMAQAAGSAVAAQVDLLTSAAELYGLDMRNRFAATFAHTPDEAIASVLQGSLYKGKSAALSKRIWKWEALQGGQIEDAITQAIAQGWSANDLANALRGFVREDAEGGSNVYDLFDPDKASYNARRLATTAINHAYWSATMMAAHDNPFAEYLHWELSAAGNHCPYCIDYAAHDEGLGIGNFPLNSAPLPHPWCTCLWYVDSTKSLAEVGRELYRWEQGQANPALNKAFGDWQGNVEGQPIPLQISDNISQHFMGQVKGYTFSSPSGKPDQEILNIVTGALDKVAKDIPALKRSLGNVIFGSVPEVAESDIVGMKQVLRLDAASWANRASIQRILDDAMRIGHTRNAAGPEFIIAHEAGHAVHNMLAIQRGNITGFSNALMKARFIQEWKKITEEAYEAAFTHESFEEIMAAIDTEMGSRAIILPQEFIAQSFGMAYYGVGDHPIADKVLQYLIRQFKNGR